MRHKLLNEIALKYLKDKGLDTETASEAQKSDAKSYASCYQWYLDTQKVMMNTAELASDVWVSKYALRDKDGICLESTPEDMWHRIAKALAEEEVKTNLQNTDSVEIWEDTFFNLLKDWKYTPGGSGLFVLGNPHVSSSASNCFVWDGAVHGDSLEGIFETAKNMATIFKYRGGCGVDISHLRPENATVSNAAKTSSGAASFMDFYSIITAAIGQCIEENQRVLTSRGYLKIKDVAVGDSVWTRVGWVKNLNTINNGIKTVYELVTKTGLTIKATEDHVFVTRDVTSGSMLEKKLKDLSIGDEIVTIPGTASTNTNYHSLNTNVSYDRGHEADNGGNRLNESVTLPETLDERLAYFVGYSYGDGSVEFDKFDEPVTLSLACSTYGHIKVYEKLKSLCFDLFKYEPKTKHRKGERCVDLRIFSKLICLYLKQNGLLKQKHDKIFMPEILWDSPSSVQAAFISGYFDADGYASGSKSGYSIASVNAPMLRDLQQLLMINGIPSRLACDKRTGRHGMEVWKDLYKLFITGNLSHNRFLVFMKESVKVSTKAFISKRDTHTFSLDGGESFDTYQLKYRMLDTTHALGLDTIISKQSCGEANVYDLQLESEHIFDCQGFLAHNCGRRAASIITMRVDHPDIFKFIAEKQDKSKSWFFDELAEAGININDFKYFSIAQRLKSTSYANVSVKLTDKFIKAVEEDTDFELWYEFEDNKYPRISKLVRARDIWDALVSAAHSSAEPGMLNWDHLLNESVSDCYASKTRHTIVLDGVETEVNYSSRTISTNPCGELPLSFGDACCIGSFYLPAFVKDAWTPNATFDFHSFINAVKLGTRAQDNIKNIDLDKVPLRENKIAGILLRRIGLGCHGLADMLAALGLKYDTDEAVDFASKVYETLKNTVYGTSVELGKEKGVAPIWEWELEKDNPFLNRLDPGVSQSIKEFGRRNIACLTNAPTGSLSILSRNCSSGIEPVFKKAYERTVKLAGSLETSKYTLYHQAVQDCIDAGGNPDIFVEANDVDPHKKIDLQAALQRHIDHSISVTTNLPAGTTKETVSKLYLEAFKKGCKGFTIYVDGSRSGILNAKTKETDVKPKVNDSEYIERPKTTDVDIFKTKYKDNMYMILVGKLPDGTPIECFGGLEDGVSLPTKYEKATLVKKSRGHYTLNIQLSEDEEDILRVNNISNRFPAKDLVTITRMVSLALRHRIPVSDIVEQLQRGASSMYDAPAAFARVLKNYISDDEFNTHQKAKGVVCPKCGGELVFKRESGCVTEQCTSCNHFSSKCG